MGLPSEPIPVEPPRVYRRYLEERVVQASRDDGSSAFSQSTFSWRTFSSSSMPSAILEYKRGNLGSITGRALERFGQFILAPFENIIVRRELEGFIKYLDMIGDQEEWSVVREMMGSPRMLDRVLEPLRPMYPESIRTPANEVLHILIICGRLDLSDMNLKQHFHTRNEYLRCASSHARFLLSLYPRRIAQGLLNDLSQESQFLEDIKENLESEERFMKDYSQYPSISVRTLVRLATLRGVLNSAYILHLSNPFKFYCDRFPKVSDEDTLETIRNIVRSFTQFDEIVALTATHMLIVMTTRDSVMSRSKTRDFDLHEDYEKARALLGRALVGHEGLQVLARDVDTTESSLSTPAQSELVADVDEIPIPAPPPSPPPLLAPSPKPFIRTTSNAPLLSLPLPLFPPPDPAPSPKPLIKIMSTDMNEELQASIGDIASEAMEKYTIQQDIAAHIKRQFDTQFEPSWHVIVGTDFGSYVTHEDKHFVYFYIGSLAVLLFKSKT